MSYRVLARTYRSGTFDDVVGQEVIATTLKNAIRAGRVHHGYLFTGMRGVGKTSMARILAKALNCLAFKEPTTQPCLKCDVCRSVAEGEDVDVVEIDAASNTGVDNIRDLRSNAAFQPARSRFKIYIIDEVHMLSAGAFNALLKTLEEPPLHVKFILATTETHKVPATIQSRCQRFDFQSVGAPEIGKHLRRIAETEKVAVDDAVLRRIARLAGGSMRDALSLLDKLLSFGAERVTVAEIDAILPPPHDEVAAAVVRCIANEDAPAALQALDQALQTGRSVERFCDHLVEHLRTLMLLAICGKDTDLVDVGDTVRQELHVDAQRFDPAAYVYMISLLEELRRSVKFSGAARALADAAVVRLAMTRRFSDVSGLLARLEGKAAPTVGASAPRSAGGRPPTPTASSPARSVSVPAAAVSAPPVEAPSPRSGVRSRSSAGSTPPAALAADNTALAERTESPVSRLSSADRDRALHDPFVQRVREAVEGTVVDVRTSKVLRSFQGAGEYELSNGEVLGFGSRASYDSTLNDKVLDLAVREAVRNFTAAMDAGELRK